ncbi:precorrin-3B C(17)-methyltransferase [Paraburkholderia sp. BCC1885]|uniref:precorrin-3B C(17)-methyltransferase n=1 Tax=Paraburkholderia sp. BCC1885 TaxID=2562669 RepID=UPI0016425357|nr:precorrin-3B C(17)-methyltransferase [Paraburkholderia sp. BCC1885]
MTPPAIVILGIGALNTARRVQACYPGAQVHGLQDRVEADVAYADLGAHLRDLYARGTPIVALCAAGIVIRCVAPLLANKGVEPPVLAVAEDGSAVVPLLGGLAGVNVMAREIATALDVTPAITTSGELRFGACVLNPPDGYALASLAQGKRFVSDLLAGESTRVEGEAPWLDDAQLPLASTAKLAIRVTPKRWDGGTDELVIHPRSVVAAVSSSGEDVAEQVLAALKAHELAPLALAALLAPAQRMGDRALLDAATTLGVPLRFASVAAEGRIDAADLPQAASASAAAKRLLDATMRATYAALHDDTGTNVALALSRTPIDPNTLGQARGRLTVIGLGPGSAELMVPAARTALTEATDILGYETYVKMAGPFRADQQLHCTDNREEMQRARHAFELAGAGRAVVVVSSGDPGVFAMAAAVLEALDASDDPRWHVVELNIVPGVSAAMATAAQAGAPLGHDFCMLSLSDNLKPWSIIETRLRHAAQADLVMAFYNPISRARPWQLDKALDILREYRAPATKVVLGRDIGRPGSSLRSTTLGELRSADVDMRTMVIVGSSTTRAFARVGAGEWVYTPRWYPPAAHD